MPAKLKIKKSNNNTDLAYFDGYYYLAFRTGPSHFPSKKVRIHILKSKDLNKWEKDSSFFLAKDLREPRFAVYRDSLYFYYFDGSGSMFSFKPVHCWVSAKGPNGHWTKAQTIPGLNGFVPWRLRQRKDTLYLSAYYGVGLYRYEHQGNLRLFWTVDGRNFKPISRFPQVSTKGAEEGEFDFDAQGNLWATVRLEGSGAYVAYAHRDSLAHWHTYFTKYKYDSALMLDHQGRKFVIARQHLRKTPRKLRKRGYKDRYMHAEATSVEHPTKKQRRKNLKRYSLSYKRTALYYLNSKTMTLDFVQAFPSTGDNAFAAALALDENRFYVVNYSSNINKRDKKWIWGQLGRTYIYETILDFSKINSIPPKID